jgi:sn-glycerol 3-phosphate transport system substrate-binding protein
MNLNRTIRAGLGAALVASTLAGATLIASQAGASTKKATSPCSPSALASAKGPVNITFDEGMTSSNETLLQKLVAAFNASQTKVHVNDVNQSGGYQDTWNDYLTALQQGQGANAYLMDQYVTQGATDSKGIIPVSACISAFKYSTKGILPKALAEETVGGSLQAIPYSVSAPILIYNQVAFKKAGIKSAPTTLTQLGTDAVALKKAGYSDGVTLKLDPWYLQIWQGMSNDYFVNNQNGRSGGRATAAAFNDSQGLAAFTELQNIVKKGDAVTNPSTGSLTTAYANLFAIAGYKSGATIDSSATLGPILSLLHGYPKSKLQLGVAEIPGILNNTGGGVQPGGNALYIPKSDSPAQAAATWEFYQYLLQPANSAAWSVGTGYIPLSPAVASQPAVVKFWKTYPSLKAAYNELERGTVNNATAGPLVGNYYVVNNEIATYENQLLSSPYPNPQTILTNAANAATSDLKAYNSSL